MFTLHGDSNKLAGFMAVVQAMISFADESGDPLKSMRSASFRMGTMLFPAKAFCCSKLLLSACSESRSSVVHCIQVF